MKVQSPYREFCRPKLADLLEAIKLDREYVSGHGTILVDADGNEILDLVGGFGAAVIGHNPTSLVNALINDLSSGVAFNAQCSRREAAGKLAARLSELSRSSIGYITNFSNSGTEANEAAIKHSYKVHFDRIRRQYEHVARLLNDFYKEAEQLGPSITLPGSQKSLIDFRDDLEEYNLGQFELFQNQPMVVALKGSYHGKTSAALKVTFNKSYREGFEGLSGIRTIFIDPNTPARFDEALRENFISFLIPYLSGSVIELREERMPRIFTLMLETVLGEGGMRPISDRSLAALAEIAKSNEVPIIIDEVQTGCGRTGEVFSFHNTSLASIEPEYICLSKALGAGLVKIGATLIRKDIYDPDFGILHTSTFGEDEIASRLALRFLGELVDNNGAWLARVRHLGEEFVSQLRILQTEYPDIIKDVRGKGLMIGVELMPLLDKSPFFRATGKQGILSLLIASYLLTYHQIRLLAPLSTILKGNPGKERLAVLRVQPPATITPNEIGRVVESLREVCKIIRANNEYCLIAHLTGVEVPQALRQAPEIFEARYLLKESASHIDARTGFVIHPTQIDYLIEYYFPSSRGYNFPLASLHAWWDAICRFLEPQHVFSSTIESHGFIVENSLIFVPYLPDYLVSTDEPKLVQEIRDKIQDAVTIARELGDDNIPTSMVGLGAYTSIVTQNGLSLNDYEVPITTGNAYTVALTLLGMQRGVELRQIDLCRTTAAVIGGSGNIGFVISQFLVCEVDRLILIGRGRDNFRKLGFARNGCIEAIMREIRTQMVKGNQEDAMGRGGIFNRFWSAINPRWRALENRSDGLGEFARHGTWSQETANLLGKFLHECGHGEDTIAAIELSNDIADASKADIVVAATNSPDSELLQPDMLKPGSILCCTSVPSNLSNRFLKEQHLIFAFDGGLASLPPSNRLDFVGMPGGMLIYGCLAETLVLGFEGSDNSFCKGVVTKPQVERILRAAYSHGFSLGSFRLGDRIFTDDEVNAASATGPDTKPLTSQFATA